MSFIRSSIHLRHGMPARYPALLTVLVAASLASPVHAQSTVQVYGLLDIGLTHVSGLKSGGATQLSSGIMEGSRLGFKGTEDLGAGYKTVFTLETRFETNNGSTGNRPLTGSQLPDRIASASALGLPSTLNPAVTAVGQSLGNKLGVNVDGKLFDRQLYLGLVTPVGAFLTGRQYTPAYEVFGTFDAMQTQSALGAGQVAAIPSSIDIRLSNTIQYRAQYNGWTGSLMIGGDSGLTTAANRFAGGMVMFKSAAYSAGIGYNRRNNEQGQRSLTDTTAGVTVSLGPGALSFMHARNRDEHPTGLSSIASTLTPMLTPVLGSNAPAAAQLVQSAYTQALQQDGRLYHVGYRLPLGAHTITVSYNHLDDRTAANADVSSYGVAYTYALSPRTDINTVLARVNNTARSQAALGGNAYVGGVTAHAGQDSTSIALGLRHRF